MQPHKDRRTEVHCPESRYSHSVAHSVILNVNYVTVPADAATNVSNPVTSGGLV